MGRGEGTLGRLGKGSAGASSGSGAGTSGNVATADDALKHKVKSMEEIDEQRKLARAAERDLKVRLRIFFFFLILVTHPRGYREKNNN